jgi:ribulose-phosphate 3-epimerase
MPQKKSTTKTKQVSEAGDDVARPGGKEIVLAPSMIAADWSRAAAVVKELDEAGCPWLHFDAMDGHFVPNLTLGPMFVAAMRPHSDLHFDVHLMLSNPGDYIDEFVEAGADSIQVHYEGNVHLHRLVRQIKERGVQAGVVINPATPVSALEAILPEVDIVLVMSVNPGFSGQSFLPSALVKIEQLCRLRAETGANFLIEVDGGMSPQTAPQAVRAGAQILVCGASSIFIPNQPLDKNVAAMYRSIESERSQRSR